MSIFDTFFKIFADSKEDAEIIRKQNEERAKRNKYLEESELNVTEEYPDFESYEQRMKSIKDPSEIELKDNIPKVNQPEPTEHKTVGNKDLENLQNKIISDFIDNLEQYYNITHQTKIPNRKDIKELFTEFTNNYKDKYQSITKSENLDTDFSKFVDSVIANNFDNIMFDIENGNIDLKNYEHEQYKYFKDSEKTNEVIADKIIDKYKDQIKAIIVEYKNNHEKIDSGEVFELVKTKAADMVKTEVYEHINDYIENKEPLNKDNSKEFQKLNEKIFNIVWEKLAHQIMGVINNSDTEISKSKFDKKSVSNLHRFLDYCEKFYVDYIQSSKFEQFQNTRMFSDYGMSYESFIGILEFINNLYGEIKSKPVNEVSDEDKRKLLDVINKNYDNLVDIFDKLISIGKTEMTSEKYKEKHDSTIGGFQGI